MGKWMLLQAVYCFVGIGFFVQDLFAKKPMGPAMLHAFIWPYAQWLTLKDYAVQYVIDPVMKLVS